MDPTKIREKIGRFRALVIGRPNAGKTTILRCIARSADGRVDPSTTRGIHNIMDELVFSSNPGFVFHDSRGIEAGATNEIETIQAFISERANARSLKQKLHAIWYCIATDTDRLLIAAEEQFFDKIDPNGVPVILIFTKFESQEADAFQKLQKTLSVEDALLQAPHRARQHFDQEHLVQFKDRKYPPKEIVYLKDMHKENAECSDILELTMKALNDATLKWLLATVQEVNLKFRTRIMIESGPLKKALYNYIIRKKKDSDPLLAKYMWMWYPHMTVPDDYDDDELVDYHDDDDDDPFPYASFALSPLLSRKFPWLSPVPYTFDIKDASLCALCFVASVAISTEHSFWVLHDDYSEFRFKHAAKLYLKSPIAKSVSQQIQAVFQDKASEILDLLDPEGDQDLYKRELASPLVEIICNNLLPHKK